MNFLSLNQKKIVSTCKHIPRTEPSIAGGGEAESCYQFKVRLPDAFRLSLGADAVRAMEARATAVNQRIARQLCDDSLVYEQPQGRNDNT